MAESSKKESLLSGGKRHILYDASLIEHPRAELFDIDSAQQEADERALAQGRGHAVFFKHDGIDLVLKHYQRGGKMAALLGDRYIGLNCDKSRSFNEWRLLRYMRELKLPVPEPVAASCTRHGLFYRTDLVTRQISNVTTLADHLLQRECGLSVWQGIGACIRRFHDASVYHADLNARNILLDSQSADVYLIDFDKGSLRYLGDAWKASNLARLQRSLLKFKSLNPVFHFEQSDWNALLDGYKSNG
ncbi:MAG: 3-deoxy-D-manno-octulosonic acid kinase [Gammaproteobacteria bacterium]|nr:3-deoxy-D-manno-octulosonic acid kinase [Gammaproteobacteria bacterium]